MNYVTKEEYKIRISDLQMSDEVFYKVCKIAKTEAGLQITEKKRALVQSRLSKRLREMQFHDFESYLSEVTSGRLPGETANFISALTTNVSSFFREPHHFTAFETTIIPKIKHLLQNAEKVRIWSAACSSGQEPYSVAMLLHHNIPNIENHDIKILATDIDVNILEKARTAQFDKQFLNEIPDRFTGYCEEVPGIEDMFRISTPIKNIISFRQLNLLNEWPMRISFVSIFCRNVVIYFDDSSQQLLWPRFRQRLHLGGAFFLGHSERIPNPQSIGFEPMGVTQYEAV